MCVDFIFERAVFDGIRIYRQLHSNHKHIVLFDIDLGYALSKVLHKRTENLRTGFAVNSGILRDFYFSVFFSQQFRIMVF